MMGEKRRTPTQLGPLNTGRDGGQLPKRSDFNVLIFNILIFYSSDDG
jgi:hypothetical protein